MVEFNVKGRGLPSTVITKLKQNIMLRAYLAGILVAQLVDHPTGNTEVVGSYPARSRTLIFITPTWHRCGDTCTVSLGFHSTINPNEERK